MGVPVIAILVRAGIARAMDQARVPVFLTNCASSSRSAPQPSGAECSPVESSTVRPSVRA